MSATYGTEAGPLRPFRAGADTLLPRALPGADELQPDGLGGSPSLPVNSGSKSCFAARHLRRLGTA